MATKKRVTFKIGDEEESPTKEVIDSESMSESFSSSDDEFKHSTK